MSQFGDIAGQADAFTESFFGDAAAYIPANGDPQIAITAAPIGEEVIDEDGATTIRSDVCRIWLPMTITPVPGDVVRLTTPPFTGSWVVHQQTALTEVSRQVLLYLEDPATPQP